LLAPCHANKWRGSDDGYGNSTISLTSRSSAHHWHRLKRARTRPGTYAQGQTPTHEAGKGCNYGYTGEPEGRRHRQETWTSISTQLYLAA
jgi:hypothetical protein